MAEMYLKPGQGGQVPTPAEGVVAAPVIENGEKTGFASQVKPIGESPTNFEAVCHDQVGQYQTDTDTKGTVFQETYPQSESQGNGAES